MGLAPDAYFSSAYHTTMNGDSASTEDSLLNDTTRQPASCTPRATRRSACIGAACALIVAGLEAWSYIAAIRTRNLPPRHVQHRDAQVPLTAWPDDLGDEDRKIVLAAAVLLTGLGAPYCIITKRKTQVLATNCMIQGFAAFWMLFDHYQINSISDWACNRDPEQQAVFGHDFNYAAICSMQEFSGALLFATMAMNVIAIVATRSDAWVSSRNTELTHDYSRWDSK